jgi:chitin synthase
MCLEIIAKANANYIIHYVPGAKCLTDPPLSLTQLVKQRRRWFNGSLFATIHVMKSMCRIWGRRWTSFFRNIFYMLLYAYMILLLVLSYVIVGLFYSAFSVFLRAILPSEECLSVTQAANVLENAYLVFMFLCLMLSTTVQVDWAETGFRICSLFMGAFTILMVVCAAFYAFDDDQNAYAVLLLLIFMASYAVPLLLNFAHLKVADFIKGVVYGIYLSPTYTNIFTIFAISNIHDVSWGSRPGSNTMDKNKASKLKAAAAKKDEMYKNYRANFLVIWLSVNIAVGGVVTYASRNGQQDFIFYLGAFLSGVIAVKLICSTIHKVVTWAHILRVKCHIRYLPKPENGGLHNEVRVEESKLT